MTDSADPRAIEEDIRQTQAELDHTLDALKEKLAPGHVIEELTTQVRRKGMDMGRNFVRSNQVPLALVGAGIAWMILRPHHDEEPNGAARYYGYGDDLDPTERETLAHHDFIHRTASGIKQKAGETVEAFNERLYQAKGAVLGLTRDTAEEAHAFRERIDVAMANLATTAASVRRKVVQQGARVAAGAKYVVHAAGAGGEKIAARSRDAYEEHPLIVGALGIAAGAVLGALLPHTQVEDRVLGDAGDALRRRAGEAARATKDAARDAAHRVVQTAKDAAEREGLTPADARAAAGEVASRVQRVGEEVIQAGREEVGSRAPGR